MRLRKAAQYTALVNYIDRNCGAYFWQFNFVNHIIRGTHQSTYCLIYDISWGFHFDLSKLVEGIIIFENAWYCAFYIWLLDILLYGLYIKLQKCNLLMIYRSNGSNIIDILSITFNFDLNLKWKIVILGK